MTALEESAHDLHRVGVDVTEDLLDSRWLATAHALATRCTTNVDDSGKPNDLKSIRLWAGRVEGEGPRLGGRGTPGFTKTLPLALRMLSICTALAMGSGFQCIHAFDACHGLAVVVGRGPVRVPGGDDDVGLALGAALGEREARGQPARTVVLRLTERDDSAWGRPAVEWLAERGRRVVVRSCVVLGRELVASVRRWGATVMLELAHPRPSHQRALVGPTAEAAAALLLHAQHLRSLDIEVAAHIGPLLPVVHDQQAELVGLARHVAAADIRDVHLAVGRLTPARGRALDEVLPRGQAGALLRAFGRDPREDDPWSSLPPQGARLSPLAAATLRHGVRRSVEQAGLRVDHCGCPAQCHLDPELTPRFVPLLTSDLFEHTA